MTAVPLAIQPAVEPLVAGILIAAGIWLVAELGGRLRSHLSTPGDEADGEALHLDEDTDENPATNPDGGRLSWIETGVILLSAFHLFQWYRRRRH